MTERHELHSRSLLTVREASLSKLHNRIVFYLTNSFILDRAIDTKEVAQVLGKEFPDMAIDELIRQVELVAQGIGVRIEGSPRLMMELVSS